MRTVPEWIAEHDDQAVPAAVQERLWKRAKSRCQGPCHRRLRPGDRAAMDHVIALCNGGEHREGNLQLLCSWCHGAKTKRDVAEKAHGSRKLRSFLDIKTPSARPVPGGKRTPWALRYDREKGGFRTVRRAQEPRNG